MEDRMKTDSPVLTVLSDFSKIKCSRCGFTFGQHYSNSNWQNMICPENKNGKPVYPRDKKCIRKVL